MVLAQIFSQPTWLYAALATIPIILLYLLRPKPRKKTLPSLMFLMRDKGKKRLTGFLRRLVINTLLFLQLLAILLFAAALAQPHLDLPALTGASNSVIILDNSASMHATDNGVARHETARAHAQDALTRTNTIILAGSIPELALEQASAEEARAYLNNWQPSHQPTKLRPAILEAQRHADSDTALTLISDFQDTETHTNYEDAVTTLQALDIQVQLQHVGTQNTNNVGIISVQARDTQTSIEVRNYDNQPRTVTGCVGGVCNEFNLEAQETQSWSFNTPPGISEVTLDTNDDFSIDDSVLISSEEQTQLDVLVVTNNDFEESPLQNALQAIQETTPLTFETTINRPPQLTEVTHDLIIFYELDPELVVSRTIRETEQAVREGAAAILLYQQAQFAIPYNDLLPVIYEDQATATTVQSTGLVREYIDMEFGSTPEHYITRTKPGARVIAESAEEHPLIVQTSIGSGSVLYYGLPTTASFTNNPEYPLFWKTTIDELLNRNRAQALTRQTGEVLASNHPIQRPDQTTSQENTLLDLTGIYQTGDRVLVANLANQLESNINAPPPSGAGIERLLTEDERTQKQDVTEYALWILLTLLFAELIYLKWRGDL